MNTISRAFQIKPRAGLCAAMLGAVALAGCAVGPDYAPPDPCAPQVWHAPLQEGVTAGPSNPAVLASWWTTLGDPILSSLIERAAWRSPGPACVRPAQSGV